MKPSQKWTTLKNMEADYDLIKQDKVYMNHLVFMYKVKTEINKDWTTLIGDIKNVKKEIDLRIANHNQ